MAQSYQPTPGGAIVACRCGRGNRCFIMACQTTRAPFIAEIPPVTPSRRKLVDRALAVRRRRARAALAAAREVLADAELTRAALADEIAVEQAALVDGPAELRTVFPSWHAAWRQRLAAAEAAVTAAAAACIAPRDELIEVLRLEQGVEALASAAARDAERRAAAASPLLDLMIRPRTEGR